MGLHGSIGWKIGEYVAAAKAIVSEKFAYSLPGDFSAGRNYLPYDSVEGCIEAVRFLCANKKRLYAMQLSNMIYYHSYLKPEMLVLNALSELEKMSF